MSVAMPPTSPAVRPMTTSKISRMVPASVNATTAIVTFRMRSASATICAFARRRNSMRCRLTGARPRMVAAAASTTRPR
jgi:hypothetical protein